MNKNQEKADGINLRPVKTQRASEVIYGQIREMITNGELNPGDRLPSERELMGRLQRSRPVIREALRMLEQAGFIQIIAGANGAVVQELSTQSVEQPLESMIQINKISLEELSEYRSFTDGEIAVLAAQRRTAEDLVLLAETLEKAEEVIENYTEFIKFDTKFHGLLAKAAKNEVAYIMTRVSSRVIIRFMERKMQDLDPESRLNMCRRILKMHQEILEAIRKKNTRIARKSMISHISAFNNDLEES